MDNDLQVPTLNNETSPQVYYQHETKSIEEDASIDEQIAELLFDDNFPDPLLIYSDTFNPAWNIGYDLVDQFITPPCYNFGNNNDDNNNNNNNESVETTMTTFVSCGAVQEDGRQSKKRKKETEKKVVSEGKSIRRRDPKKIQEHIIAERKRRESLSHMFISLAALIPGLKKMDKVTILGDAIKHMKQLQEKVKNLEAAAAQINTTKSMMMVKKHKLPTNDDDDDGDDDDDNDNCSSPIPVDDINGRSGGSSASDGGNKNIADNVYKNSSHTKINVKIFDNTLFIKICCDNRKSILPKIIAVVDRLNLVVTHFGVVPIQNLTQDITIVAHMEDMEEGFNFNVRDLVRSLRSTLQSTSPRGQASNEDRDT